MTVEKNWTARWITDERFEQVSPRHLLHKAVETEKKNVDEHREDLRNQHMLVRHTFVLNEKPKHAQIDISADDYYKLFINGCFVGQGPAQSYASHYFYNQYDITDLLQAGENVVAVHVYYQGLVNRALNSADYRQGMIAELFCDGLLMEASDASWKYTRSLAYGDQNAGTIAYETQFVEQMDSREVEKGWKAVRYQDDHWMQACEKSVTDYTLLLQPTPTLQVYRLTPPQYIRQRMAGI